MALRRAGSEEQACRRRLRRITHRTLSRAPRFGWRAWSGFRAARSGWARINAAAAARRQDRPQLRRHPEGLQRRADGRRRDAALIEQRRGSCPRSISLPGSSWSCCCSVQPPSLCWSPCCRGRPARPSLGSRHLRRRLGHALPRLRVVASGPDLGLCRCARAASRQRGDRTMINVLLNVYESRQ